MKIYTKKGDKGTTQLIGGTRVGKDEIRIDAYGTIDELNSFIGLLGDQKMEQASHEQLLEIQDRLFTIGSTLASDPLKSKMELPEIIENDVIKLEAWIDSMENELEPMQNFILPGGHTTVSYAHICRCVCRRAERIITTLNSEDSVPAFILSYINRLSDYFFVLGRKLGKDLGAEEKKWNPRG